MERRIGGPITGVLDGTALDRFANANVYGPVATVDTSSTLAMAAANADVSIAEAGVRLARANRVPDLNVGPAIRRLEETNDLAAVLTVSIPIPVFNNGRAAITQATAQQSQADAQRRVAALDIEQAITDAQAQAANAETAARTASGPALAAAEEAARKAEADRVKREKEAKAEQELERKRKKKEAEAEARRKAEEARQAKEEAERRKRLERERAALEKRREKERAKWCKS